MELYLPNLELKQTSHLCHVAASVSLLHLYLAEHRNRLFSLRLWSLVFTARLHAISVIRK